MDVRTEQAYQEQIAGLKSQLARRDAVMARIERAYQEEIAKLKLQLAQREGTIVALQQQNAVLSQQVADLSAQVARLLKNSSNSSKPPSSDIVKPPLPPTPNGEKRRRGGQRGHPRHQRTPFSPAQIDRVLDHQLGRCPDCGGAVRPLHKPPRTLQQVELPAVPVEVTEHRSHGYFCPHCRKVHYAPWPQGVQVGGLVGSRLTALIAYLKGACHCSLSTIRKFC